MQTYYIFFAIAALIASSLFLEHKLKARIKNTAGSSDRAAIALRGLTRLAIFSVIYLVTFLFIQGFLSDAWPLSVNSFWGFGLALVSPVFGIVLAVVASALGVAAVLWLIIFGSWFCDLVGADGLANWFYGTAESVEAQHEGEMTSVMVCIWPFATALILHFLIHYGSNGLSTASGGKTLLSGLLLSAWCGFYFLASEAIDRLPKLVCTRSVVNG